MTIGTLMGHILKGFLALEITLIDFFLSFFIVNVPVVCLLESASRAAEAVQQFVRRGFGDMQLNSRFCINLFLSQEALKLKGKEPSCGHNWLINTLGLGVKIIILIKKISVQVRVFKIADPLPK